MPALKDWSKGQIHETTKRRYGVMEKILNVIESRLGETDRQPLEISDKDIWDASIKLFPKEVNKNVNHGISITYISAIPEEKPMIIDVSPKKQSLPNSPKGKGN